jgi:hypothetical protein
MAIQPIDLQTLFTQLDKVGRAQSAQREGLAVQQAMQGVQIQRKTEEHIQSVNEAQDTGDGAEKVTDRKRRGGEGRASEQGGDGDGDKNAGDAEQAETPPLVFRDPLLGRKIDISL